MTDQYVMDWELEQLDRAGLDAERKVVAGILWATRAYLRDRNGLGASKPLPEWTMADIIRVAANQTPVAKLEYAHTPATRRALQRIRDRTR